MSLKILLADDSLTAQNMGKKILTEAGYEVIAVSNGAQAIKKIVSENPDLVVLDVYMPGYSGLELCERIRTSRETATIPVVLSVGKMEAFKPEEGSRVRADGLIVKPFEATELLAVVKKLAENVSSAPRPKRRPEPETVPESVVEPLSSAPAEPEFEVQPQSFNIPQEIASTPVIGMELIPEEAQELLQAEQPAAPIELEVEQAPARMELDPDPCMPSADGPPVVFEVEPSAFPVVETAAAPAPVDELESFSTSAEVPTEFQEAHAPSEDSVPETVEHDFFAAPPPEAYSQGAGSEFAAAPALERFSASVAPEPPSAVEADQERIEDPQPEASTESVPSQSTTVLPELASWDDDLTTAPAETPHSPADSMLNGSDAEFAPAAPVWVAEEAEIEPQEFAMPLHQQMQRQVTAGEDPESAVAASPAESADAIATKEAQAAADPAPTPESEDCADVDQSKTGPQAAVSMVTEAPVDPARIASIVDQVLERLKPELVAAVTRALEKNSGQ